MLDLSGLNLEKEDKNKIDLSGLGLEKEDKNEIDLSGLGLEKQKRTVTDVLESVGSKIYGGVNKIVQPATYFVTQKQTQQQTKAEPILRAPTKEDDNTDGKFAVENNPDYALSAQDKINADRQGLVQTDPITPLLIPGMAATTGGIITRTPAMTKLGTLIFEGLLQTKNAIVRNVKGKQWNPFEIEGVAELIPDDEPGALKFMAGLGEMVADGVLTGHVENAVKNKFIKKTADDIYNLYIKKGWGKEKANKAVSKFKNYVIERMTGRTAESVKSELGQDLQSGRKAVAIQGEPNPIDIDEAVKINRQVNKMEIPQAPEKPLKADADINIETEPGRIETEKNIVKANRDINVETEQGRIETGEKIFNSGNIEKIIVKTRPTEYIKPTNIDKYVTKRIEENIVAARNKKEKKTSISKVSPELIADAKANGMDLTGYIHNIDTSAIRHIFKNHGNVKTEKSRGQIAITDEDIKTLPNYITKNYDYIAFGLKNDKGLDIIAYAKNMPDGSSVYMEEVRTGKKTLTTKTLYKRQTGINPDIFRRILQSSIVPSNNTGTNIIGQNGKSVNNLENDAIETGNENSVNYINYNDTLENITKQVGSVKEDILRERLENVVRKPVEEIIKNFPNNVTGDNFELVKGNIYKINNSAYGIYIGKEKQNGLLQFISSGNHINSFSPNNVLVDVSDNYVVTDEEKEIAKRFVKFLDKDTIEIQPHESLIKKDAEQVFRNNKTVEHNELGATNFSVETVDKILRHKGFDTSTVVRLLPELYKNSVLIDSPTEKQYTGNKQHKKHTNIAFWHNTLNKFKIQNDKGGYDEYFVRFTVTEQYAGKKKPKGSIGERTLHSTNISEIEIQKKDGNAANIRTTLSATLPSDDIVADYIKIVNKILKNKNKPKIKSNTKGNNLASVETHGVKFAIEPDENVSGNKEKVYQRTYDLAEKFGVSISESNYKPRNATGVYYDYGSKKGNVFVNSLLNIDTVTHEVVHALDDRQDIIRNIIANSKNDKQQKEILRQLRECAIKHYGLKSIARKPVETQAAEGIATMIQMAIVDPTFVKKNFYEAFTYVMQKYPPLQDLYVSARQIIVDYEGMTAIEKVSATLYDKPLIVKNKNEIPFWVFLDRTIFDSDAILKWMDNDLYLTAKGYRKILGSVIGANLHNEDGMFYILDKDGNAQEVNIGDNWRTFLKKVVKTNSNFDEYLVTRRFVSWYRKLDDYEVTLSRLKLKVEQARKEFEADKNNKAKFDEWKDYIALYANVKEEYDKIDTILKNNGRNRQDIETAFKELDTDINQNLAEIYDKLHNATLETLHNSGVITDEVFKEFLDNYGYAPFSRNVYDEIYADDKNNFFSSVTKLAGNTVVKYKGVSQPLKNLKRIKGSELAIISPVVSSVRFMASAYREAYKYIVINKLVQMAPHLHEFMQVVPYSNGMEHANDVFVGRIKNKKVAVKIKDINIYNTVKELFDMGLSDGLLKMALTSNRLFTKLTTGLSWKFAAANFLRDQATAFVSSKTGYIPIISSLQILTNKQAKPYVREYDNLFGGDTNTMLGNLDIVSPLEMGKALGESNGQKFLGAVEKVLGAPSSFSESLARRAEYVRMRIAGADMKTASRAAEEITGAFGDFGRWFNSVLLKSGIKVNSFLNATLQVGKIYLRSISNPKTLKKFLFTLGLISLAAFELARRKLDNTDDEYNRMQFLQIMPEMLTRYLYVSTGKEDDFIRIPVDNVFASLGVFGAMLYANAKYNAKYKLSDMVQVLTDVVPDQFNFAVTAAKVAEDGFDGASRQFISWLPQPAVPVFGLVAGKRIFPDLQDIEPMAIRRLPNKYRFNNRTSETAKYIGGKLGVSPMRIDYALDQTFGQMGKMFIRGAERVLYSSDMNKKDNFDASINTFRNLSYFASGRLIQDFYDNKKWTDELYSAKKQGFELSSKELTYLRMSKPYTDKISKILQEHNKRAKVLNENKNDLSLDEQERIKKEIQKIELRIIKEVEQYNNVIKII